MKIMRSSDWSKNENIQVATPLVKSVRLKLKMTFMACALNSQLPFIFFLICRTRCRRWEWNDDCNKNASALFFLPFFFLIMRRCLTTAFGIRNRSDWLWRGRPKGFDRLSHSHSCPIYFGFDLLQAPAQHA